VYRPRTSEHPEDETFPGLLLLRVEGRIFFLNARRIGEQIEPLLDEPGLRVVIADLSGVFDLEYTALKALIEAEKRMREGGVELWLVGLTPGVLETIRRSSLADTLGRDRMHFNLEIAVHRFLQGGSRSAPAGAAI
jgi:anti-anti-sigma factor